MENPGFKRRHFFALLGALWLAAALPESEAAPSDNAPLPRPAPLAALSVAFLYLDTPEGQGSPIPAPTALLCWHRIRDTDHQSIP